ncbi:hypothetical protein PMAYCL1PPCAC_30102, partial [Pristionchus mayeri]
MRCSIPINSPITFIKSLFYCLLIVLRVLQLLRSHNVFECACCFIFPLSPVDLSQILQRFHHRWSVYFLPSSQWFVFNCLLFSFVLRFLS